MTVGYFIFGFAMYIHILHKHGACQGKVCPLLDRKNIEYNICRKIHTPNHKVIHRHTITLKYTSACMHKQTNPQTQTE